MPVYTPKRQRVILLLLLTSMLLVTLDLTGTSSVFGRARVGFGYVLRPFEILGETVSRPIERTWDGITQVDELKAKVIYLQEQVDSQRWAEITGRSAIAENGDLRAAMNLQNSLEYPRVTARIVGAAPTNFAQQVEIDQGSTSGIEIGMAVINSAGLVGRITQVAPESSIVMLMTDPSYHVQVKIVGFEAPAPAVTDSTVPSGLNVTDVTSTTTTTTLPATAGDSSDTAGDPASTDPASADSAAGDSASASDGPSSADASSGDATPADATATTTTTTTVPVTRETGVLDGYGVDRLPRVRFVADAPQFGTPAEGDLVLTTGGRSSLAPPDLPIGIVRNIIPRPGSAGLELEVELSANLRQLNFLTVILYKPPTEIVTG